jgi:hypothetical protein
VRMHIDEMDHFAFFDFDEQICNLYRSGGYYSNSDFSKISLEQQPGFLDFETHHNNKYPGYRNCQETGLKEPKNAVKFDTYLKETLLAKAGVANLDKKVFLDGSDLDKKVAYASYSRSGNTLFRIYIENATGIWTGSDGDLNQCLHYALQHMGFAGESYSNNHV